MTTMVGKAGEGLLRVDLVRARVGLLVRATRFVVGPVLTLAVLAAVVHQLARALLTRGDLTALRAVRSLQEHLVHADYLFLNEIEAGNLLGSVVNAEVSSELEQAARAIVRKGVRRVVTLHTEKHAVSATVRGEVYHQESLVLPVEEIAGANGAGDAFAAGLPMSSSRTS